VVWAEKDASVKLTEQTPEGHDPIEGDDGEIGFYELNSLGNSGKIKRTRRAALNEHLHATVARFTGKLLDPPN
jgi:hypothetical protein